MSKITLYLVQANPLDGRDDEFNDWYERVHLPEVVATPGIVSAQRYRFLDTEMSELDGPPAHRYLVVYEMDDDPDVVMGRLREQVSEGVMSIHDSLDLNDVVTSCWTPQGRKVRH